MEDVMNELRDAASDLVRLMSCEQSTPSVSRAWSRLMLALKIPDQEMCLAAPDGWRCVKGKDHGGVCQAVPREASSWLPPNTM
jgi:hypothetical protein